MWLFVPTTRKKNLKRGSDFYIVFQYFTTLELHGAKTLVVRQGKFILFLPFSDLSDEKRLSAPERINLRLCLLLLFLQQDKQTGVKLFKQIVSAAQGDEGQFASAQSWTQYCITLCHLKLVIVLLACVFDAYSLNIPISANFQILLYVVVKALYIGHQLAFVYPIVKMYHKNSFVIFCLPYMRARTRRKLLPRVKDSLISCP